MVDFFTSCLLHAVDLKMSKRLLEQPLLEQLVSLFSAEHMKPEVSFVSQRFPFRNVCWKLCLLTNRCRRCETSCRRWLTISTHLMSTRWSTSAAATSSPRLCSRGSSACLSTPSSWTRPCECYTTNQTSHWYSLDKKSVYCIPSIIRHVSKEVRYSLDYKTRVYGSEVFPWP